MADNVKRLPVFGFCLALVFGMQAVGASTVATAAVPGLVRTTDSSEIDSRQSKIAFASCPPGTVVLGGGGRAIPLSTADTAKVVLTRLRPTHSWLTGARGYSVVGEEVLPGTSGDWLVEAYAICATVPDDVGYDIKELSTAETSQSFKEHAVACPQGRGSVTGTGAEIVNGGGQVTLQLTRSDYPRGIARAAAKERSGYSANWSLTAYVVCVDPDWAGLRDFTVELGSSPRESQDNKFSTVSCEGRFVHGPAAVTVSVPHVPGQGAPAGVGLQSIFPRGLSGDVDVIAVETVPTGLDWEASAHAICG